MCLDAPRCCPAHASSVISRGGRSSAGEENYATFAPHLAPHTLPQPPPHRQKSVYVLHGRGASPRLARQSQPCSCFILFDCGAAPSVTLLSDCDACAAGEVRARECRAAGGWGCDGGGAAARGHTQVNTCLAPLPPPYHHHVQVFGCVRVIAGVLVQGHCPHPLFHPSASVTLLLPGQELCVRRTYNATYVRRRG
jgi:hypothetical protein